MPLFDDIELKNMMHEEELYVSVKDLAWHLTDTMKLLYDDLVIQDSEKPISKEEYYYFNGLMQGLNSVVILLSQGGIENNFHRDINSVDDLVRFLEEEND